MPVPYRTERPVLEPPCVCPVERLVWRRPGESGEFLETKVCPRPARLGWTDHHSSPAKTPSQWQPRPGDPGRRSLPLRGAAVSSSRFCRYGETGVEFPVFPRKRRAERRRMISFPSTPDLGSEKNLIVVQSRRRHRRRSRPLVSSSPPPAGPPGNEKEKKIRTCTCRRPVARRRGARAADGWRDWPRSERISMPAREDAEQRGADRASPPSPVSSQDQGLPPLAGRRRMRLERTEYIVMLQLIKLEQ